jgi:hypothetical protein
MSDLFKKYLEKVDGDNPSASFSNIKKQETKDTNISEFGKEVFVVPEPIIQKTKPIQRKIEYKDNKPIFRISQSLIKKYTNKRGDELERCPYKIYTCYIIKSHSTLTTLPMLQGSYFETKCIGGTAYGSVNDLPRKVRPVNEKTLDHIRIDRQIINFKTLAERYGLVITEDNIQIRHEKEWNKYIHDDVIVLLTGVTDIETSILYQGEIVDAVIDLKLTGNLQKSWGDFDWQHPEFMDHIQMDMYYELTGKEPFYWVFDIKNEENLIYHHIIDEQGLNDLEYRINKTALELKFDLDNNWKKSGSFEICKDCPHNPRNGGDCKEAINIKEIKGM